jgi:hypothetical protein
MKREPRSGDEKVAPGKRSAAWGSWQSNEPSPGRGDRADCHEKPSVAPCMIKVGSPISITEIPVIGSFSLLLSLCEWLWKCAKPWECVGEFPQKNTGGRKRTPFELRARPGGRSSARRPGSSRTGPCPFRLSTYRRKGERLGRGITLGGLP